MSDQKIEQFVLPVELLHYTAKHFLDVKSLGRASCVNQFWKNCLSDSNIWKDKIIKDFKIKQNILSELPLPIDPKQQSSFYKNLYRKLYCLQQKFSRLPKYMENGIRYNVNLSFFLACCTDDDVFALKHAAVEERFILLFMSICAGCINIPVRLFQKKILDLSFLFETLNVAARSGNLGVVSYLLDPKNKFSLKPNQVTLNLAVMSGNLELVHYLLNPKNKFNLHLDQEVLNWAVETDNLEWVRYLLNPENKLKLRPDQHTLTNAAKTGNFEWVHYLLNPENKFDLRPDQDTLDYAAHSGSLEWVSYLLNPENNFNLHPSKYTLPWAAASGNAELVSYLINPESKFDLRPYQSTLNNAAESGNLELVRYLLHPKNHFNLSPHKETLNNAASSGNLALVRYLLHPENKFDLHPTLYTLCLAASSDNLEIAYYLLHPENKFDLHPNQETLNSAALRGNLEWLHYLLNPENNFGLRSNIETFRQVSASGLEGQGSKCLLLSNNAIQQALQILQQGNFNSKVATEFLKKSYDECPNHFFIVVKYVLSHPNSYKLSTAAVQFLSNASERLGQARTKISFKQRIANLLRKVPSIE